MSAMSGANGMVYMEYRYDVLFFFLPPQLIKKI